MRSRMKKKEIEKADKFLQRKKFIIIDELQGEPNFSQITSITEDTKKFFLFQLFFIETVSKFFVNLTIY